MAHKHSPLGKIQKVVISVSETGKKMVFLQHFCYNSNVEVKSKWSSAHSHICLAYQLILMQHAILGFQLLYNFEEI